MVSYLSWADNAGTVGEWWSWMSRKDKPKPVSNGPKATINEKLDAALKESFPASDPVALGQSEHIGQPRSARKRGDRPLGRLKK